jgi:threonine synthase
VESLATELVAQCSTEINHVFIPIGGGGLLTAVCRGLEKEPGAKPLVHGVQPEGCPTVLTAFARGVDTIEPVQSTTRVSGLSVTFDVDASLALRYLRKFGGQAVGVSDEEVFRAQQMLLTQEGIYTEPAGATALAGLCRALSQGFVKPDQTIVCLVTGNGFKDPESIQLAASTNPATSVEVTGLKDAISGLVR